MARKPFKESKNAKKWLTSSKHDLDVAFLLFRDGGFTDTVCYFCHQTAEKGLKTLLIANNIFDFPHTHRLKNLLKQSACFNPQLKEFEKNVKQLDKYYIETKYPPDFPVVYSPEETQKAIDMATKLYEFIEKQINIKIENNR